MFEKLKVFVLRPVFMVGYMLELEGMMYQLNIKRTKNCRKREKSNVSHQGSGWFKPAVSLAPRGSVVSVPRVLQVQGQIDESVLSLRLSTSADDRSWIQFQFAYYVV